MSHLQINRKILRLSFGIALVTVLVLPARAETAGLLEYIPDDVVYCKVWEPVGGAPEGPKLRNHEQSLDDWIKALDDILEWRILKKELASLRSEMGLSEDASLSDIFAGERSAMAVFGLGNGTGPRIPSLLFIWQPKDIEQAKAALQGIFEAVRSYGIPVIRDAHWYEDTVIESNELGLGIPGLGLAFVAKDDLLFACTNAPVLERILNLPGAHKGQLQKDPDFVALQKELPEQYDEFSYLNWARLVSTLEEFSKLTAFIPEKEPREVVNHVVGEVMVILGTFRAHASTEVWDGKTRIAKSWTLLSEERPEVLQEFFNDEPRTYPLLKMAPQKTESVWACNMFSLPDIWKTAWAIIDSLGPQGEPIRKGFGEFQTQAGINIEEDLLSWMGSAFGVIKFPVDLEGFVPINHFALWVEVTDEEKANALLEKIAKVLREKAQLPVTVKTEEYEGRTCSWIEVPIPFFPYQPSMTTVDGGLLICTHPNYLHDMLDVYDGRAEGLVESEAFESVSSILEKRANSIEYVDTSLSLHAASKTMERIAAMQALAGIQDEKARKAAFAMRRLGKLFAILATCQAKASNSSVEGNFIRSEQWAIMRDLPIRVSLPSDMRGNISMTDIDKWLPEAIRGLNKKGQKGLALALAQRMGQWLPEKAELAEKMAAEIRSATEPENVAEKPEKAEETADMVIEATETP